MMKKLAEDLFYKHIRIFCVEKLYRDRLSSFVIQDLLHSDWNFKKQQLKIMEQNNIIIIFHCSNFEWKINFC